LPTTLCRFPTSVCVADKALSFSDKRFVGKSRATKLYNSHVHQRYILSRLADISRGFGTYERVWITAASKDSTRLVILLLHVEVRVPIHQFRRCGLQLLRERL
jgi:hypothetical protein